MLSSLNREAESGGESPEQDACVSHGLGSAGGKPTVVTECQVNPKGVALTSSIQEGPESPFPQAKPGHQGLRCNLQVFQDWQRILTFKKNAVEPTEHSHGAGHGINAAGVW